jgi:hypothetical protein
MLCATVSCRSRAIRSRSSATRRAASASRSSFATRRRSAVSAASACLPRTTSPSVIARNSTAIEGRKEAISETTPWRVDLPTTKKPTAM